MRPGCDRTVVARLTYDTISCQVWLDPVRERPGPAQEICELHTSRLTVPRGWMLCDRREESPALFVAEPAPVATTPPPPAAGTPAPSRPAAPAGPAAELQPELFAPAATAEPAAPAASVEPATRPVAGRVEPRVAQTAPIVTATPDAPGPREPAAAAAGSTATSESPTRGLNGNGHPTRDDGDGLNGDDAHVDGDAPERDDEDLPESLQASSPLLSRAFRATGHQRSVLTQTLLNESD